MTDHLLLADRLYDGDGETVQHDMLVEVRQGRIAALRPCPAGQVPQGAQRVPVLAPGFIDLQVNGAGGVLFNDAPTPRTLARIAEGCRKGGVAHLLPTFITAPGTAYAQAIRAVAAAADQPALLGVHLEGPFLSPHRPGIHPAQAIRPLTQADCDLIAAAPVPVLLTLAVEEQDPALLAQLARAGVILFAGHSQAQAAQIDAVPGLRGATHLFNAMPPVMGRAPSIVGRVLTSDHLMAGIIADGLHVDPLNLALAARMMGDRLCLVSDAMATLGADIPGFDLLGTPIRLQDGRLTGPDGTLAGAQLFLDQAVRLMIAQAGVAPARAIAMASAHPARALGLQDQLGGIRPGLRASLTLLDAGLHTQAVMVDGVLFPQT